MKMDFDPYLWCWFSPDPRMLLLSGGIQSLPQLEKAIRENRFEIRIDHDFRSTIESCASTKRVHEESTWIESDMIEDYIQAP